MRPTHSLAGRWLLLSDIHFRAHDLDRIQRTARWIETLPQLHDVTRVVICGDLLSSRTNQPTHVLSACYRFLSNLIDTTPRVNILLGNHDLAHKRDYTTTALDALSIRRLSPFVELHSAVATHKWDGRHVLTLPFREDQGELTDAVSRLKKRTAAKTVAFAHLAIHKAVTQRHVIQPLTGEPIVRPITHRGMTGPANFASLARTFTGHFHSPQTMLQSGLRKNADPLQGSVTYLGSPLQLTWADLHDEQRGVVLLDPDTLHHELLVNPYAVDFVTVDLEKTLHDKVDIGAVAGKHAMLIGDLSQFKYVTARDKLLTLGARSVRNWSPMTPILQTNYREGFHMLGASIPASDFSLYGRPSQDVDAVTVESVGDEVVESTEAGSQDDIPSDDGKVDQAPNPEPEPPLQVHPLDLVQNAKEYVKALRLDASLADRRRELIRVGTYLIQASGTDTDESGPSYQDVIEAATSPSRSLASSVANGAANDAEAKHVFVAKPQALTVTNFLGIQETITINFNDLPRGLAFIVGTNGSGKSTLLEAMTWCQFGRCLRNGLGVNDVINDVTGKNCSVSLVFDNGYTISRYRKHKEFGNRVIVTLRDEVQTQLEKDDMRSTQAAIDELLGIDYETYIRTVVLGHESAAGFLSSTALQRRELIESLLGLSPLDQLFDLTKRMVNEVDTEIGELESQHEALTQTITHIRGRVTDLKKRRKKLQKGATAAATALETALEEQSALQEERDEFVEQMHQTEDCATQALAELRGQVDEAQREVDDLKAKAHTADLRIAFDTEQSDSRNGLYDSQRRVHELRQANAAFKPPSSLRWRILQGAKDATIRLQQWLKDRIDNTNSPKSGPLDHRITTSFLVAVEYIKNKLSSTERGLAEYRQQLTLEQLHQDLVTAVQDMETLNLASTRISERVALARDVDEQEVLQSINDMTIEEARDLAKQHSAAVDRMSLLMADLNQTMQQRMHEEYAERTQRDELGIQLAELGNSVIHLQNNIENNKNQTATYSQLLDAEAKSIAELQRQQDAQEEQIEQLASSRELFAFWETAMSRRQGKGASSSTAINFRGYVLGKSLKELNSVLSQILTLLYDDTRHIRDMTSGMLRSLYQDTDHEDQGHDTQQPAKGAVLDETLGINSALSYAKRSGGERKRIDLALFFSLLHLSHSRSRHRARYLLVDEVFDGLDVAGQAVVVRWCRSSMARMEFVFVITHSEHMVSEGEDGEGCLRIEAKMGDSGTVFDFGG